MRAPICANIMFDYMDYNLHVINMAYCMDVSGYGEPCLCEAVNGAETAAGWVE